VLKYPEENEMEPIIFFQHPKKTRKRKLWVSLIPSIGVNLVATSSQVEILHVEAEHVQEQTYPLTEAVREGGVHDNKI
jgi:hypothetical protein